MSTEFNHDEPAIEAEIVDMSIALTAMTRGEIDIQIATAKAYPRSIKEFKRQALELACLDEETAGSMFYSLRRSGKAIEGPSVRLAEVIRYSWEHIRAESFVSAIDDKFVTATGTCFDLQKNIASRVSVKRRITDKNGNRFNDDMIGVTSNAACSIAMREATFRVIPRALFKDVYEAARRTAVGDEKTIAERRARAIHLFEKIGITKEQIFGKLGRKGIDEITLDDLAFLTGLKTSIQDGEISKEEAFSLEEDQKSSPKAQSDKTSALQAKLDAKKAGLRPETTPAKVADLIPPGPGDHGEPDLYNDFDMVPGDRD